MDQAEKLYKEAKSAYDKFRMDDFPLILTDAGLDEAVTSTGYRVRLIRDIHCSPNKNESDQEILLQWLKQKGGAHMIKSSLEAEPDPEIISLLMDNGIDFVVHSNVNTNSLKAWLKSQLGYDGVSVAQMDESEIPECVHFYAPEVVDVKKV